MSFSMLGNRLHFPRCRKSRTCRQSMSTSGRGRHTAVARMLGVVVISLWYAGCCQISAAAWPHRRLRHVRLLRLQKGCGVASATQWHGPYQQLAVVDALHVRVLDGRAAAPLDQPRRLLHELPNTLLNQHMTECRPMHKTCVQELRCSCLSERRQQLAVVLAAGETRRCLHCDIPDAAHLHMHQFTTCCRASRATV